MFLVSVVSKPPSTLAVRSSPNDEVIFSEVVISYAVSPSLHLEEGVKMSGGWQDEDVKHRMKEGLKPFGLL